MKFSILFFSVVSVVLSIQSVNALPPDWLRVKTLETNVTKDKVITGFAYGNALVEGTKETGNFDQLINHFSKKRFKYRKDNFFKQRYFIDSTFAKGKDSPVIYYICGEGTCEGSTGVPLVDTVAKEIGAYRIALEHRYYGYSQPYADLSTDSLYFLTMEQAIEDLATFQKHVQESMGLTGKWISVGGSYPGELSAFYRLYHPELVVGALASSAPVLSKADFEEYDHHVAKVANADCLKAIQIAVADVEQKLKNPESNKAVKALFKASDVKDDIDFLYNLADMSAIAIQYGYQNQFCSALTQGLSEGKVVEAYATIGNQLFARFGLTALQDAFEGAMSTNPADYLGWAGMRSWMYQSCTQFGFYQIAYHNPAESSRSSQITQQYHNQGCERLFGLKVPVNTDITNRNFYEPLFHPSTTNIYYTNGSNDPWSNLSITNATPGTENNPNMKFFVISGSAHCDDLGSRFSTALVEARDQFKSLAKEWLK